MDDLSPIHVLIVDDNPANLVAMSAAIDGIGASVVTAGSGDEALRYLLRYDFAAILMDIQMPGLDGFETAEIIRRRRRTGDTPIIFITAISQADTHVARGYALGAVDYVFKPVPPEVLRAKLAIFVDLARRQQIIDRQGERFEALEARCRRLESSVVAVARDLRAPIREIEAICQGLPREDPAPIEQILAVTARMTELVGDLSATTTG